MNAIDDRIEVHIESFNVDEQNKVKYLTVPLGDWLERKKVPTISIKQQFGFCIRTI
jgi:hypothetical protein